MKIPAAVISIPTVKPTLYRMTEFRSRMEARWAVVFDHSQMPWVYEPQGFFLPSGEVYIPDFWLPVYDHKDQYTLGLPTPGMFAEVKPDGGDFSKARELSSLAPVLLLEGVPEPMEYEILYHDDLCSPAPLRFSDTAIQAGRSAKFEELLKQHHRYYY